MIDCRREVDSICRASREKPPPSATMPLTIPATPEALTADWLTAALRESGVLAAGSVSAVSTDRRGLVSGFYGDVARLRVEYTGDVGQLPATIIGKFPTSNAAAFEIGLQRGYFAREVAFYRELASGCGLRVPAYFGSGIDPDSGGCVLLLEDLSGLRAGTERAASHPDDVRAVLAQLAAFHGRWWGSSRLADFDWLPPTDDGAERYQRNFAAAWEVLFDRLGGELARSASEVGIAVAERVPAIKGALAQAPAVFLHADVRSENIFFDADGEVVVLDWQHCRRGRGAFDVATYLFGVARDLAVDDECALLATYHEGLGAAGVEAFTLEDCLRDYQLAMVDRFVNVGSTLATVDPDSASGQMALEYLARCSMARFVQYAKVLDSL